MQTAALPLVKVVLFNAGVGYFEHEGTVEGDARVELTFNTDDVNDLLKSMVVRDLDGGQVSSVTYASKDPVTKTLKTFSIDLTSKPTLAALLDQIRGQRIEVDAQDQIAGVILGVERRRKKVGKDETVEVEILNLVTDEGLRAVALDSVSRLRLLDEKLDAELRQALEVLAGAIAQDKKTVAVNFLGEGQRRVRLGYIRQTPIWKTSYRLVLGDDRPPWLQGWAIVENTTEQDWNDVRLTLVSGRPISFVMDLYQPLYAERPTVELELYTALRPPTHDRDLGEPAGEPVPAKMAKLAKRRGRQMLPAGAGATYADSAIDFAEAEEEAFGHFAGIERSEPVASGERVGELFQYAISTPVSLSRQRSAMLPIVNTEVSGEKLSVYNQRVHQKHALNAVRLRNTTELHLMQGPVTVFDEGVYAGDARMDDLPPGGERLLSYALDLEVEVVAEQRKPHEQMLAVTIARGQLKETRRRTARTQYTVKSSAAGSKTVLVEHAFQPGWKLIEPDEPAEKTRDLYRFVVPAEPEKTAELMVAEGHTDSQRIQLIKANSRQYGVYLERAEVPEPVKTALAEITRRNREASDLAARRLRLEKEIEKIGQEQERIRKNLGPLAQGDELYKRYLKKFNQQEDRIEQVTDEIRQLREQEAEIHKQLEEYVAGLELE